MNYCETCKRDIEGNLASHYWEHAENYSKKAERFLLTALFFLIVAAVSQITGLVWGLLS